MNESSSSGRLDTGTVEQPGVKDLGMKREWVSVVEQLPPEPGNYLAWLSNGYPHEIDVRGFENGKFYGSEFEVITHWMPLPCAPSATEPRPDLLAALKLAYEAMNYLGDILNNMDGVEPEDEEATNTAFAVVRAALAFYAKPLEAKPAPDVASASGSDEKE